MRTQIVAVIESHLEDLKLDENRYDESLAELGMNSISFIQVIVELEERLQIEIPDEYLLFSEMDTINKMISVVLPLTADLKK